ncbi:MAG TPA: T9SS type A sorting domain-containing protein [Bacteroidia bacterium]|nr:T9SS type A sorting domain-containing protein [Bacteroidia bacterium]
MGNKTTLVKLYLFAFLCFLQASIGNAQDTIKVNPSSPGIKIPDDFTGMAYESDALHFDSLKPTNHTLVQYFKTAGVKTFRLGGNSVEYYKYNPTSTKKYPADTVTNAELDSLFKFAAAVGCKIILGLDFGGYFNPNLASNEVSYVMAHYSQWVLAFEIGNEPNLYYRNSLRTPAYTYDSFQIQFMQYVDTIRKYTPNAPICGPSAARLQAALYTDPFVHYMYLNHGIINLLTQHNYSVPKGMPTSMEIDSLLSHYTIDSIRDLTETLVKQADSDGVPFQMDESNALYNGGQWRVSTSLATALWSLDYMFTIAKAGANGLNFHTTYDTNATIINDLSGNYSARAPFYGIVAFQVGSKGRFIPDNLIGTPNNLDIFPVIDSVNDVFVTLINKDTLNPVQLELYADSTKYFTGQYITLTAPTVSDTFNITLGGSPITPAGTWISGPWTNASASHGYFPLTIPHATALIIKLNGPTLGIDELRTKGAEVSVYPNPNNGIFSVVCHSERSEESLPIIEIYNALGQSVLSETLRSAQGDNLIDLSNQPSGLYLFRIIDENGSVISNGKFVIEK